MSDTKQLEEICAKVEALEQSATTSKQINQIVYSIIIAIIAFYAFYVPSKLAAITQPEIISSMAMDIIEEKIPSNDAILTGVEDLANREMKNAFEQLDQKIPEIKKQLIDTADKNFAIATDALNEVISNDVAKMLKESKAQLDTAKEIAKDEDNLNRLATDLSDGIQIHMNEAIDTHLKIEALDSMLAKLQYNKNLTQEEYTQKQVLAYAWVLATDENYREELKGKAIDLVDKINQPIAIEE